MALRNGLALFGPTSWAAAVRAPDGGIQVASGTRPRIRAADRVPFARGVVRMSEMLAALPMIRRELPDSRFSFESGNVAAAARRLHGAGGRRCAGAGASAASSRSTLIGVVPSLVTLRSRELVRYHGAEHKTVAGYEQGVEAETTAKEHERCGSHLVAPLLLGAVGAAAWPRARRARCAGPWPRSGRWRRSASRSSCSPGASATPARSPRGRSRSRARRCSAPLATAEPGEAELEVAEQALAALLAAEDRGAGA